MKFHRVKQQLRSAPIVDIAAEVHQQLDSLPIPVPKGDMAITVGSRGIHNIAEIVRATGTWLRDHGASPFIIPSMGSHNGATAEGQRAMIESLGITESAMGMPIRSSMECVEVGKVATGTVWMDRFAYEAAGTLVVNRVKLHTCFSGPVQSGLVKMMVVGMGKIASATTFHSAPTPQMKDILLEMGQFLIDSGKIWGGLAILEDGFDQTAELHALPASEIMTSEPGLLDRHREYFPRLPIDDLEVLIVDEIGKTYSGTGMDTNVIGYRGVKGNEDLAKPDIKIIAALSLYAGSQGNALGVGLADFITQRLRDEIDERKTFINAYTTGDMTRAKIPATLADDQEVFETIASRFGKERWMVIPNTLHLGELFVSPDLVPEITAHPICDVSAEATPLAFANGRHSLFS